MKEVLVTIIIPIYNVEKYLRMTLNSVQAQTLKNLEVIMIDDGSTDGSSEIAQQYAQNDKRFQYYYQSNRGLSASRNEGLKRASGKYIVFLDSDDTIEPDALKYLYNLAEHRKVELILFGGQREYYDVSDTVIEMTMPCGSVVNFICNNGTELYEKLISSNSYFTGVCLQFVKREIFKRAHITFYEGIIHEDHLYTFQILNSVQTCMAIDYKVYHYRMRANSITTSKQCKNRFFGFFVTYHEMINWIETREELKRNKVVIHHIDKIWLEAVKYIVFMKKDELPTIEIQKLKECTKKYYPIYNVRHYLNCYYLLLRIAHYIYLAKRKWS